ncbi:MAG: AAA family ATPase, partial [Planctomycetota bacterium]
MSEEASPIRLTSILLKNFRGWLGEHRIRLGPGLTLLLGENGSGKSSALNAIEWCLFGAEVARKGSGIDERGDWEIQHRASRDEVKVILTFDTEAGPAKLTRSRAAGARVRDPDLFQLELPDEGLLDEEAAGDWMSRHHLPDWTTWKQAFCQHQEQLRVRLTDSGERSLQLGRLLGLEAYQEFNDELKALKVADLEKAAGSALAGIEEELKRAVERPGAELRGLEDQLEARGIARAEIGDALIDGRARSLLADARELAAAIGLAAEFPDADSSRLEDAQEWANHWEARVQSRKGELERELGACRGRWQELDLALKAQQPSEQRRQDARAALDRWMKEHGDEAALDAEHKELEGQRMRLLEEEKGRNATLALLRHAAEEAKRRGLGDACPVCGKGGAGLDARLARSIEEQGADDLAKRLDPIKAREARLEEQAAELSRLRSAARAVQAEHDGLAERLRSLVPADDPDATKAARSQLESWKRGIADLADQLRRIDAHLGAFRSERELLGLLARWRVGRARAEAATGDLQQIAAFDDLQRMIDEAANLACDLDMLGSLAREAQERRSAERVEIVNTSLGRYFRLIAGDPAGAGVRVQVKSTATRLIYRLVDAEGADVTPILNQAALNALSFAMLFAQA